MRSYSLTISDPWNLSVIALLGTALADIGLTDMLLAAIKDNMVSMYREQHPELQLCQSIQQIQWDSCQDFDLHLQRARQSAD